MDFNYNSKTFRRCPAWTTGASDQDWSKRDSVPVNGTKHIVDGETFVFYDDYWIRYYKPPADTLVARKNLIESLTRRTFHHTEHGINTPGHALEGARACLLYTSPSPRDRG